MSPSIRRREPRLWQIHSITVRQRDGPHRLRHVYRLLLSAPLPDASRSLSPEEETDAGSRGPKSSLVRSSKGAEYVIAQSSEPR